MASENLDLVRSLYASWERGDFDSAEWAHPEIEYGFADGPSPGNWSGLEGMAEAFRAWSSAWEEFRVEAEEFRELDSERVLVLTRRSGRGKASGVDLAQLRSEAARQGADLFHIRGGRVTKLTVYFDRERALADLGIKE